LLGSPVAQYCFWLMIVSIAIGRLAGPAVADDQLALAAPDRGQRVDGLDAGLQRLADRTGASRRWAPAARARPLGGLDLAEAVERLAEGVDHAPR
jgi:hypothetical protein